MKKNNFKFLIFILAALFVIQSTGTMLIAKDENHENVFDEESNMTAIVDDALEEDDELELSEFNEDFNPNEPEPENGISVAPLKIENHATFTPQFRTDMYPLMYDLRLLKKVSPVKDQGPNGSCWAFAAYGSMESNLLNRGKGLFDFSEKHLRNMHEFDWGAQKGGNRDMAAAYFASGKGPVDELDDPYDPAITYSKPGLVRSLDIDRVIYLPDVIRLSDINYLKDAIMEYGGVYSTVNSSNYYENNKTYSMYNPGFGAANHAVTIIGWDDTFPATAFTQRAPGDGAWICKNSWGTSYMDKGYYYVSYYDGFIGKSPTVFIPRKKDIHGRIYQYDPFGATKSVGFNGEGYMTNIFTAKNKELLHQVGLFNVANQTAYEIYIVRNVKRTSQLTKERIKIAEGEFKYPGYYTVDVTPEQLEEGEQFAIVVYMNGNKSDTKTPLPIESKIDGYTSKAEAKKGQSYFSKVGKGWTDLTTQVPDSNFCIKAITTTDDKVPDMELEDKNDNIPDEENKELRGITFELGKRGFIEIDKRGILRYSLVPKDAENVELEFGSYDNTIAIFNEDATLSPQRTGNVDVYIRVKGTKKEARFNVQVVNPGMRVPNCNPIEIIGENNFEPGPIPPGPNPPGPNPNPNPKPDVNPYVPITLYTKQVSTILTKGEEFNLEPLVGVYPETAIRNFGYESSDPEIVEVTPDGKLIARNHGDATITIMTDNNLKAVFKVKVFPDNSNQVVEIVKFENSKRTAGVFHIYAEATVDGMPYNGSANIKVESEGTVKEDIYYFNAGKIDIPFTGFDFGTWKQSFTATIKVRDKIKTIRFDESGNFIDSLNPEDRVIEITKFINSPERRAGVFHIDVHVLENGKPYNGIATIKTSSDSRELTHKIRIKNGVGKITYTGFSFGVWKKDFTSTIDVEGRTETIKFGY